MSRMMLSGRHLRHKPSFEIFCMNSPNGTQSGLSIVEALVTMVILLIVMGGVYQIFESTSLTYRMQQGMARVQESGRFAMDYLLNDIRMAGFLGCFSGTPSGGFIALEEELVENKLIIRRAMDKRAAILGIEEVDPSGDFTILKIDDNGIIFSAGEALVVNNCNDVIFTTAVDDSNNGTLKVVGIDIPDNFMTNNMGEIMNLAQIEYTIDHGSTLIVEDGVEVGVRSLFRKLNSEPRQEVVEGVDAIRFRYGIDTNNDRNVDDFVDAASVPDWGQVRSVRIALLAVSPEEIRRMEPDPNNYNLFEDVIDPATDDRRRMRRIFEASIGIRNRLQ